jgi:hypothetical protein
MPHLSNSMPAIALDPGEGVLLADRDQHVVAGVEFVGLAGRHQLAAALGVVLRAHLLEGHAGELAVLVAKTSFGTRKLRIGMSSCIASSFSHGDAFISSKPERTITFTLLAAEAARGAAAVHRGVAAAQHDHALADLVDVAEETRGQPVDADMDVGGGFLAARHVEVAAARRAAADEHRVVAFASSAFRRRCAGGGTRRR